MGSTVDSASNTLAESATLPNENDVFISYSRKDKAFVQVLDAAFRKQNRDPWVDWDDIRKGEDWWHSIQRGIEAADTFVFVVSPASLASEVCQDEIKYAAQCHKRFLPIIHREGFDHTQLPTAISRHNWLFFREVDDFDASFQELLEALNTDLPYIQAHTRLLLRSLEWKNKQEDSSYLLRGTDLDEARQWLNRAANKEPRPTDSQIAYVNAGSDARMSRQVERRRARWIVGLTTVVANFLLVFVGLYTFYFYMSKVVEAQGLKTMKDALEGTLKGIDGDNFQSLVQLGQNSDDIDLVDHPLYQEHQTLLNNVHTIDPEARSITYTRLEDNTLMVVGDALRGRDLDNLSAVDPEDVLEFGQTIVSDDIQGMLDGLKASSLSGVDAYSDLYGAIKYDENLYDSWIDIYAPIQNSTGATVGALNLRYDTTYLEVLNANLSFTVFVAYFIAFIWLVVLSYLILRATRMTEDT